MTALAEITDVEDRLGRAITSAEANRAQAALNDASARVRAYCRRDFITQTITQRLRPVGGTLKLTRKPVTSVTSAALVGLNNTLVPLPVWTWDGLDELWIYGDSEQIINLPESLADIWRYRTPIVQVVYNYGYTVVPDDVVAVVAGLAARVMSLPAGGGVMSSETAEAYSYQLAAFTRSGPLAFTDADREILDRYRPKGRTLELRG